MRCRLTHSFPVSRHTSNTRRAMRRALATLCLLATATCHAEDRYDNPVDGMTYRTEGEFRTYEPEVRRIDPGRVQNDGIVLLTGENEIGARTTVDDLVAFLEAAEKIAREALAANAGAGVVLIQFNCVPSRCEVQMAHQGEIDTAAMQATYDGVSALAPLATTGEVRFQLRLRVRPPEPAPAGAPAAPVEPPHG